ncbi:hypothetical protein JK635_02245 [Neobacillus sp. YIM B02564]|uniref:Uncharacterized protein n=1 Tax=Neobacillus paridis TaxID=2803862 RepID=A0ABS1TMD8_9BACI|nr:hypothetical protein [Neobacillus paridis]MBL4951060.1 hypothetical protein [Neobacillus paridis]
MGQRLNIEIVKNGETLANAYYHWSAYTSSSLELTKIIINAINEIKNKDDVVLAVRLLEKTGALLTSNEIEVMKQRTEEEFKKATNRNDGLISISEEGIESTRKWQEEYIEIHLDKKIVNFNVFWNDKKYSYLDEHEKSEEWYQQLPKINFDYTNIPFTEFNQFATQINQLIKNEIYNMRLENGDVLSFIK